MAKDKNREATVDTPPPVDAPDVEAPPVDAPDVEVDPNAVVVVGDQHLRLISRDPDGFEIKAMKIGEAGILVAYGMGICFSTTFIPNGDIRELASGLKIS